MSATPAPSLSAVAIVPAAGLGRRFGDGTNKPFVTLQGKPLIVWTLLALAEVPEITEIIPVIKDEDMDLAVSIIEKYGVSKVRRIAPGGKERQDSIFHGLKLIKGFTGAVVVHDGVRPLIQPETLQEALRQLTDCDGVVVGVPVKDTIKELAGGLVAKTLRRDVLWHAQTPQVFRYATIAAAYERAYGEGYYATDDAALVERYGGRVRMVAGSYTNIKITTPEDVQVAEAFMAMRGAAA